jgi:hypothetical protein
VLIGTAGWRARFGRILALFSACATGDAHRPPLAEVAARYEVPIYRNLQAMAVEWGPDREVVERLIA